MNGAAERHKNSGERTSAAEVRCSPMRPKEALWTDPKTGRYSRSRCEGNRLVAGVEDSGGFDGFG